MFFSDFDVGDALKLVCCASNFTVINEDLNTCVKLYGVRVMALISVLG